MVQVAIPDNLADRLHRLAIAQGLSLEEVIRITLVEALESPDHEAARARLRVLLAEGGGVEEEEAVALALRVTRAA